MRRTTGLTLIELITVIAILCALAGLAFSLTSPARESAKQRACVKQLEQIFVGLSLYAADYDAESLYPEPHGLSYIGITGNTFAPYVSKELWFCPEVPQHLRSGRISTYSSSILVAPVDSSGNISSFRKAAISMEKQLGTDMFVVECTAHDELYYAPSERSVDLSLATPHKCLLRVNGSVFCGRYKPPRDFILTTP